MKRCKHNGYITVQEELIVYHMTFLDERLDPGEDDYFLVTNEAIPTGMLVIECHTCNKSWRCSKKTAPKWALPYINVSGVQAAHDVVKETLR